MMIGFNPITGRDDWGLTLGDNWNWDDNLPNPWVEPIEAICGRYSGIKKFLCKKFYNIMMCSKDKKIAACNAANRACIANCGTLGGWNDNDNHFNFCVSYCNSKQFECALGAK